MCATAVVSRRMPMPYSQERVTWFVWSLGPSVEEAAFYLVISTWITLDIPCYIQRPSHTQRRQAMVFPQKAPGVMTDQT